MCDVWGDMLHSELLYGNRDEVSGYMSVLVGRGFHCLNFSHSIFYVVSSRMTQNLLRPRIPWSKVSPKTDLEINFSKTVSKTPPFAQRHYCAFLWLKYKGHGKMGKKGILEPKYLASFLTLPLIAVWLGQVASPS